MSSSAWHIVIIIAVFVGVIWFITKDTDPEYAPRPRTHSHNREKFELDIITFNEVFPLTSRKVSFPASDGIFRTSRANTKSKSVKTNNYGS
jgi:hypothetical protein